MKFFDSRHEQTLAYGFGHLVGSFAHPDDAHSGDSFDLAYDVFNELGLDEREQDIIRSLAQEVAGNYEWTGKADELRRRIEAGEV